MINWIKSFFKKKEVKKTFDEMVEHINRSYYFDRFEESLVDEIYTLMLDYGSVKIIKESDYKYLVDIMKGDEVKMLEITEDGFNWVED